MSARSGALTSAALRLTRWAERWFPDSFVIAVLLTLATLAFAVIATPHGPADCVRFWGDGFWTLLSFAMQMCLVLVTGSVLADAPPVRRALDGAAGVPRTGRGAVTAMACASMLLCWLHWGLGLVASAFLVRSFARRHRDADFRLLVTAAYFGMGAIWHAGPSGSATLLMATPKNFLEAQHGVVPLGETTFSAFNLGLSVLVFSTMTALAWLLYPRRPQDARLLTDAELAALGADEPARPERVPTAWLRLAEHSRLFNLLAGGLGLSWVALDLARAGAAVPTLDKLNFLFFFLGVLLHPSPQSYARSAEKAAGLLHGIVVQFPLYAGIYGVIKGSGLDVLIARSFLEFSTPKTFPLVVYWYSAVLNYFIPSGGAKWAIEAPYVLEAGKTLGVPASKVVLAYAWGEMLTDIIQPFFAIPLLAVARLEFKDILGYAAVVFAVNAVVLSAAFLLF